MDEMNTLFVGGFTGLIVFFLDNSILVHVSEHYERFLLLLTFVTIIV